MTKRIISLILCLSLLLSMFAMTTFATEGETPPETPIQGEKDFAIVGDWIWGETVAELGADEVVARSAEAGITDIYLLVKGVGGKLGYNNTQFPENITRENMDVLQETIDAAHAEGIRVHAWLVTDQDETYKANNPDAGMWHYKRARDNENITPYDEGYNAYMAAIATELASNYEIDGIHLDYIRYNHLCNGWSELDFANLEAMGANIENVKYLINKTFYADLLPEGESTDGQYIFNALRNGDPDAMLIAQYRRQNVVNLAKTIIEAAKAVNPELVFSAAFMPEGAVYEGTADKAFADLHYGQNYEDGAALYDYIVPMAYSDTYGYSPEDMAQIAQNIVAVGNKVVMGLQSGYPLTSGDLQGDIEAIRGLLPSEDVLGIAHFRHALFSYAKMYYDLEAGKIKVQAINTYASAGWRWVRFEAAEGVKFTGATLGQNFAPDAPIEIAEDGSWIKIGYADDAAEEVLPTLTWGKLELTFEGAPVDPDARIAYARIWINSNESRAYNAYAEGLPATVNFVDHDGTLIDSQYVAVGEAAVTPANPLRPGFRFMGWDKDCSAVTEDMTVTATYREIPHTQVVEGFDLVGEWVWGETVAELGADVIAERCAKNGITDIYMLTKGTGGLLGYNK
ncbi:MAG: family 10 glycosylhydrolase, partial [Oscillospiraceae bacterium]|nr:family 10 glycosylhydrolase [Oscillospiraceae bacterium]